MVYDNCISLIDMPDHKNISVCVYTEQDELFAFGERINKKFEEAYMNGYNWDAVIRCYVAKADPQLMSEVETDPEAGLFAAYISNTPENLKKMKRFEAYLKEMLSDEQVLMDFIAENRDEIEWD